MLKRILAAAVTLSIATSALAADPDPVKQSDAPKPDRKLCRIDDDTGSIRTKRVCHTAEEWHQIDDANARNASTMLGRRSGAHDGPGM